MGRLGSSTTFLQHHPPQSMQTHPQTLRPQITPRRSGRRSHYGVDVLNDSWMVSPMSGGQSELVLCPLHLFRWDQVPVVGLPCLSPDRRLGKITLHSSRSRTLIRSLAIVTIYLSLAAAALYFVCPWNLALRISSFEPSRYANFGFVGALSRVGIGGNQDTTKWKGI